MTSFGPGSRARTSIGVLLGLGIAFALGGCARSAAEPPTTVASGTTLHPSTDPPAPSTTEARHLHRRHHASTTTAPGRSGSKSTTTTLPAPGPGLVAGRVTILGDSVTVDAKPDLQQDIKGAQVDAAVSQQWYQGVQEAQRLRAAGELGTIVVVALGTNGPITSGDVAEMVHVLAGVSRIVFVTDHVPTRDWQDPNNHLLEQTPSLYPHAVVADWASLGNRHPGWFYSDQVHMPIGGPGAQAMAALIAAKV